MNKLISTIGICILLSLLPVFASDEPESIDVLKSSLSYNIDVSITSAQTLINKTGNTNLSLYVTQLEALKDEILAAQTMDELKVARDKARDIIKAFREEARKSLSSEQQAALRAEVKAHVESRGEIIAKRQEMLQKIADHNAKRLELIVKKEQRSVLNASDDDLDNLPPEVQERFALLIARLAKEGNITRENISTLFEEMKMQVEALKEERESLRELLKEARENRGEDSRRLPAVMERELNKSNIRVEVDDDGTVKARVKLNDSVDRSTLKNSADWCKVGSEWKQKTEDSEVKAKIKGETTRNGVKVCEAVHETEIQGMKIKSVYYFTQEVDKVWVVSQTPVGEIETEVELD
jgi:hypothetical protein